MDNKKSRKAAQVEKPDIGDDTGVSSSILAIFTMHQRALRRFIAGYVATRSDIDDISQETFLRAYQAENQGPIEQPKSFLFKIAKNLMLSELARKSHKVTDYIEDFEYSDVLSDSEDSLEANIMAQQKLGIYCEAVAALPPSCRRVVLLRKVYGMSHKEIARHMGISVSTVEKHLARGLRQCSAVIAKRYGEATTTWSGEDPVKSVGEKVRGGLS